MADISINFKTSLSNAFFYADEDNERFDDWLNTRLKTAGLYTWEMLDNPTDIPGVFDLTVSVSYFDDYDHSLRVTVDVDNDSHSDDELYDNQQLLNYIDRVIAPKVITELNALLSDIVIPMYDGETFYKLKFDDNEFYCVLGYLEQYGFYAPSKLRNTPFAIEDDFEVLV